MTLQAFSNPYDKIDSTNFHIIRIYEMNQQLSHLSSKVKGLSNIYMYACMGSWKRNLQTTKLHTHVLSTQKNILNHSLTIKDLKYIRVIPYQVFQTL